MTETPHILPAAPPPADRDAETARLLLRGDQEGLRRVLMDHSGKVLGLLRKEFTNVLDLQEIEDVVSQASLRLWRAGNRYDPARGTLGAWLYVIARNCARRMLEAKRRHAMVSFIDDLDSQAATSPTPAEVAERASDVVPKDRFLLDVQSCIADLPPQQRAVLLADFAAGGSAPTEQLAEQLQTSRNSIYVSRNNGRKALRNAMLKLGHTFDYENVTALEGWS